MLPKGQRVFVRPQGTNLDLRIASSKERLCMVERSGCGSAYHEPAALGRASQFQSYRVLLVEHQALHDRLYGGHIDFLLERWYDRERQRFCFCDSYRVHAVSVKEQET